MTQKQCTSNCLYAIDGRCRLEHKLGETLNPTCPHYEGHFFGAARGIF